MREVALVELDERWSVVHASVAGAAGAAGVCVFGHPDPHGLNPPWGEPSEPCSEPASIAVLLTDGSWTVSDDDLGEGFCAEHAAWLTDQMVAGHQRRAREPDRRNRMETEWRKRFPPAAQRRRIRVDAGLTQTELGARLGVSVSTVSRWESAGRQPSGPELNRYLGLLAELDRSG